MCSIFWLHLLSVTNVSTVVLRSAARRSLPARSSHINVRGRLCCVSERQSHAASNSKIHFIHVYSDPGEYIQRYIELIRLMDMEAVNAFNGEVRIRVLFAV